MRLIVQAGGVTRSSQPDRKLVRLIAQGQDWFQRLASGNARSPEEIAQRESCTASYVTRVAQLAFLAPDVIDAITQGTQPPALTAKRLIEMVPLPMAWAEQRTTFNAMT